MIRRVADRIILLDGWRRALAATAAGATGALAMPPVGFWPALVPALVVAVWLIDGTPAGGRVPWVGLRRAAAAGWFWGFGYFTAGLWWIGAAFLVEADVFAWLLPFGIVGLPALLAVFTALGFLIARSLWSPGARRLFALAFGLGLVEWLRGWVLTGFPWNSLGLALGQNAWLMQGAALIGMWGLTLLAILALASPATLATDAGRRARLGPPALGAAALGALALFGAWRIPPSAAPTVPGVKLRILQPNLAQDEKFRPALGPEILARYLALSDSATAPDRTGIADVTHLVWPESAFPFLLHREPFALSRIADALPPGTVLVTGAAREGTSLPGENGRTFFNAIQAVNADGAIVATYDKIHLVPFGEYVPAFLDQTLRTLGIRQFVQIPGGFTAGERGPAFDVPGLPPVAASICYEAIFTSEIGVGPTRPGLLLNVTNDGWFGNTPGPYQHLAQARLRAVEQGLPLVRAANTGISAIVDPYGRLTASLGLGRPGVVDGALPAAISPTLYARSGSFVFVILCTVCLLGAWTRRRRRW